MGGLRGRAACFLAAGAGRMARPGISPLVFGFFCGGFFWASALFFFLVCFRRSFSSSSSGLLSDSSSSEAGEVSSASLSWALSRFRFALPVGEYSCRWVGTRPDLRRGAEDVISAALEDAMSALIVGARSELLRFGWRECALRGNLRVMMLSIA